MKKALEDILREAGKLVLPFCGGTQCQLKKDASPITEADRISHTFLEGALQKVISAPVVSEEGKKEPPHENLPYWLIDPLDGTKEFLAGCSDFCINVALMREGEPAVGSIYAPALNEFYYAALGEGVFVKRSSPHQERSEGRALLAVVSKSHRSEETERFLSENALSAVRSMGSALKFCSVAVGEVDVYPRFEGSSEWDTAAGHLILKESGGEVWDMSTGKPMIYGKPRLRNNAFLACRSGVDRNSFVYHKEG